jgi:hypothetical protein
MVWGFGSAWIGATTDARMGLFAWRVVYGLGVIWIAPLFYHFVCVFLNVSTRYCRLHYYVGAIFTLTLPTPLFFQESQWMFNSFYYAIGGKIYPLYFIWWMGIIVSSHWLLIRSFNSVDRRKAIQIKYFFVAIFTGFLGGSTCYLPNFGIKIYPWGNFSVFLYPLLMSYAMLKYQLMDVRVFLRRAFLLIGVYIGLLLLGLPVMAFIHSLAVTPKSVSNGWLFTEIALVSLLLSYGPFLYAYFVRNRSYFKEHTMAGLTRTQEPISHHGKRIGDFRTTHTGKTGT